MISELSLIASWTKNVPALLISLTTIYSGAVTQVRQYTVVEAVRGVTVGPNGVSTIVIEGQSVQGVTVPP